MTVQLLTPTIIAKEAALQVDNHLVAAKCVSKQFVKEFKKIGDTVTFRKPVRYTSSDGPDMTSNISNTAEASDTLQISEHKAVALQIPIKDMTLTIEEFSKRHIRPAAIALANDVDTAILALYKDIYSSRGTPGTTPSAFSDLADVGQLMDEQAAERMGRKLIVDPAADWGLMDGLKGIFQPVIVKDIIEDAIIGRKAKFDILMDQNVATHTVGVATGTPLVDGGSQSGTSLLTNGWTASQTAILKQGDIFTIADVNAVNPITKVSTGQLQQFVVTADANSGAGLGAATFTISPTILATTDYQTVDALPANDAIITVLGTGGSTYKTSLALLENAFALVTVPFERPQSAVWWETQTYKGIHLTLSKGWDAVKFLETCRLDIQFGVKTCNPESACRMVG